MPIYMDRHDLSDVTAKDISEAHQLDVKMAPEFNCKTLTYWFDERKNLVFCLIDAPNKKAVRELHKNSHGSVPNHIIEVECDVVEIFLGRVSNPEIADYEKHITETAFRTIMSLEVFYPLCVNSKLEKRDGSYNFFDRTFSNLLKKFEGRELQNSSDSLMASFRSIPNAIGCAIEIQKALIKYNNNTKHNKIEVVIGVTAGSPVTESEEFFGDAIKLGKSLCSIGRGGQIIISSVIRDIYKKMNLGYGKNLSVKILNTSEENFLNQLMELTEKMWNDENFNLDKFSKQIGLSRAQLYRKITDLTGHSPNNFIREIRLKNALRLIEARKGNISEIAYESGFNNPSYFSKCFQRRFGVLPSEYASSIM